MFEILRKPAKHEPPLPRAGVIFCQLQDEIYRNADRLFAKLMFWQWLATILIASVVAPQTWEGQSNAVQFHLWGTIFLGGALTFFPIWLTRARPGAAITRYVVAVAQMLMSSLLISITGGRIESHFHVFVSLVILSFYRDWRVLIPATIVVGLDHFIRGMFWPYSVYGTLIASPWRSVEHVPWVVVENIFLAISCFRSTREMRAIANRTAALEASSLVHQANLESALDCIITIDRHGRIREYNPAAEKVFGYTRAEAIGSELVELIIPERMREAHRKEIAHYLETGEGLGIGERVEIEALRADGSEIFVELALTALHVDGAPTFTAYLRDITDRVRHDRRRVALYAIARLINESTNPEETTPQILKNVAAIGDWSVAQLWLLDQTGKTLNCESAWHRDWSKSAKFTEFSYSKGFAKGNGLPGRVWESEKPVWISDVIVDSNFPRLRSAVEAGLRGGFAFPLLAGSKFLGVIEVFSPRVVQPDEDLIKLAGAFGTEIGLFLQRKEAEQTLRDKTNQVQESERNFRSIFEAAPIGVAVVDLDYNFVQVNPALCEMLRYSSDELLQLKTIDVTYPEDAIITKENKEKILRGNSTISFEKRYVRKTGEVFWVACTISAVRDQDGKPLHVLGTIEDISKRKVAEEQIRELNQSLEQRVGARTAELRKEIKERMLVERTLVASEERYRTLFEKNPEPMWVFDDETLAFLEVNEAAVRHYGYSREEFLRMSLRHIRPIEDIPALLQDIERLRSGHRPPPNTAWRHRKKDGTIIDAAVTSSEFWWNGHPAHLVLALDITERKQAEEAVRAAEQKYRAIFENSIEGVFQSTPDGKWLSVNPALARMYGCKSPEALMACNMSQLFVDPTRRELFKELMERHGFVEGFEFEVYRQDGSTMWLSENSRAVRDDNGAVIYYEGAVQDVTERKRAERALRAAEYKYRAIFENAIEGIFQTSPDGRYISVNPALARLYGYDSPEELMAVNDIESTVYVDPKRRKEFKALIETDGFVEHFEYEVYRKDGSKIWLRENARAVRDAEGAVLYYEGSVEDITQRKRVEEVERANQAKSEFLSRISHELRTPLNAILGFGQLLERQAPTEAQKPRIRHIINAGQHLLGLINEVLDISRIEAGRIQISLEPVCVADALSEVIDLMRPLASERAIQLLVDTDLDASVHLLADRQRFKQVLLNLVTNAVKYTPDSGSVKISYEVNKKKQVRISVLDTGPGIPEEKLPLLFVPFERLGAEYSQIEGTGLGLAVCQRLMQAMHGSIGVESAVGKGSTFWVELPRTKSPLERAQKKKRALPPSRNIDRSRRKILYIEDNLSNLTLIEQILAERPEIELLSAMQGSMGLDLARKHSPDLILLDLHLPDLPGWKVLAHLREAQATRQIPVVIISADATASQIKRLMQAGAAHYLTKPLNVADFLRVLDETTAKKGTNGIDRQPLKV